MAKPNNKDKAPKIDESVLEETPPNINEPQTVTDDPENQDPNPDEKVEDETAEIPTVDADVVVDEVEDTETPEKVEPQEETQEQKDIRYKQQQTESQIQVARNKALTEKIDQASQLPEPTEDELKAYVAKDGVNWDELTVFEQSTAKKTYLNDKRFELINQAAQSNKQIDEWAAKVDTFIDSTDGKPEFVALSSHEAEFRSYCMKEAHRGAPIDVLLGAFLHNLPKTESKRGSLFPKASGGEKDTSLGKITDADTVRTLRENNPREYARQVKAGKITIEL